MQLNPVRSASSLSDVENSSCGVISEVAANGHVGRNQDIVTINCPPVSLPKFPVDNS